MRGAVQPIPSFIIEMTARSFRTVGQCPMNQAFLAEEYLLEHSAKRLQDNADIDSPPQGSQAIRQ